MAAAKPRPEVPHFFVWVSMWWVAELQVFLVEAHVNCCCRFQPSGAFPEPFSSSTEISPNSGKLARLPSPLSGNF